jgi:hypothetical protein
VSEKLVNDLFHKEMRIGMLQNKLQKAAVKEKK